MGSVNYVKTQLINALKSNIQYFIREVINQLFANELEHELIVGLIDFWSTNGTPVTFQRVDPCTKSKFFSTLILPNP